MDTTVSTLSFPGAQISIEKKSETSDNDEIDWSKASTTMNVLQVIKLSTVQRQFLSARYLFDFTTGAIADAEHATTSDRIVMNGYSESDSRISLLKAAMYGAGSGSENAIALLIRLPGIDEHFILSADIEQKLYIAPILAPSLRRGLLSTCKVMNDFTLESLRTHLSTCRTDSAQSERYCENVVRNILSLPRLQRDTQDKSNKPDTNENAFSPDHETEESNCFSNGLKWRKLLERPSSRRDSELRTFGLIERDPVAFVVDSLTRISQKLTTYENKKEADTLKILEVADELKRSLDDQKVVENSNIEKGMVKRKRRHKISLDVRDKRRVIGAKEKAVAKAMAGLSRTPQNEAGQPNTTLLRRQIPGQNGRYARTDTVRKIQYSEMDE